MDVPGVCHCCHPFCHSVLQWPHVFKFILSTIICKLVRPVLRGTCSFTNFCRCALFCVYYHFRAPWLTSWLWWLGLTDLDYLHNVFCLQRTYLTKLCKINNTHHNHAFGRRLQFTRSMSFKVVFTETLLTNSYSFKDGRVNHKSS